MASGLAVLRKVCFGLSWLLLAGRLVLPGLVIYAVSVVTPESPPIAPLFLPVVAYLAAVIMGSGIRVSLTSIVIVVGLFGQLAASVWFFGESWILFVIECFLIEFVPLLTGLALGTMRVHAPERERAMAKIKADLGFYLVVTGICLVLIGAPIYVAGQTIVALEIEYNWVGVIFLGGALATAFVHHVPHLWKRAHRYKVIGLEGRADLVVGEGDEIVRPVRYPKRVLMLGLTLYVAIPIVLSMRF